MQLIQHNLSQKTWENSVNPEIQYWFEKTFFYSVVKIEHPLQMGLMLTLDLVFSNQFRILGLT